MNIRFLIALFVLFSIPNSAYAQVLKVEHTTVPEQLDPDRAYILFESNGAKSGLTWLTPILMRIPSEEEMASYDNAKAAAYEKSLPNLPKDPSTGNVIKIDQFPFDYRNSLNVFGLDMGNRLNKSFFYFVELPPGDYVIYGSSLSDRALNTCNCLGTVQFFAAPGVITNLGKLHTDKAYKPSKSPLIEDDLPSSIEGIFGQAILPANDGDDLPFGLDKFPVVSAKFKPVGPFVDRGAPTINRLAPIPGVLEYERGRVIIPDQR